MSSVGVFVDAGYLFAQGSAAIAGSARPRSELTLNEAAVVAELTKVASNKSNGQPLLRIYWYDATRSSGGLTLDHSTLAHTDYIKLRLGFINSQRQQKGVDSLIVTDLIELARNNAMSDAVLLSGDEDVRIGVQIAQSFGVRVHLLGIKPSRGSQSLQLMQEADTTTEWDAATVGHFLTVQSFTASAALPLPATIAKRIVSISTGDERLDRVVHEFLSALDSTTVAQLRLFCQSQAGLPPEIDGRLLAKCRTEVGTDLNQSQKRSVRKSFTATIKSRES